MQHIERFNAALTAHLGLSLTLDENLRDQVYRTELLHRTPRQRQPTRSCAKFIPTALALYDVLQQTAALPEDNAVPASSPETDALCRFATRLPAPLSEANRRALLTMLVAVTEPELYEKFAREACGTNE